MLSVTGLSTLLFAVLAIVLMIWVLSKGPSASDSSSKRIAAPNVLRPSASGQAFSQAPSQPGFRRVASSLYNDPSISSSSIRDQFPAGPSAPPQDGNDFVAQRYTFENFRRAALMAPTAYMRPEMQGDGGSKLGDRTDYKRWLDTQNQLQREIRANGQQLWQEHESGQGMPVSDAYSRFLDEAVHGAPNQPNALLARLAATPIPTSDDAAASRAVTQITQAVMQSQVPLRLSGDQIAAMQFWLYEQPRSETASRIAAMQSSAALKEPLPL